MINKHSDFVLIWGTYLNFTGKIQWLSKNINGHEIVDEILKQITQDCNNHILFILF